MNTILWQETMKILIELVGYRQGIDRSKQAILYLDGCSSHSKAYTMEECVANNILPIYFPSNTSHVVQPADGAIFQRYKPAVAKAVQDLNLKASLGAENQKHFALAASLEVHREVVTPDTIKAGFKKRGIYPFDRHLILVNAHAACPQKTFQPAPDEALAQLYAINTINELKSSLTDQPTLTRKQIETVNKPISAELVDDWKRASRGPKKTATKASPPKKARFVEVDDDEELEDTEEDIWSGEDPQVGALILSVSANQCSHCGHTRTNGTVPLACFDCSLFWLCMPCQSNTAALQDHMKTHPETEGRRTRRRAPK